MVRKYLIPYYHIWILFLINKNININLRKWAVKFIKQYLYMSFLWSSTCQQQGEKPYAYDERNRHKLQPLPSSFNKIMIFLLGILVPLSLFVPVIGKHFQLSLVLWWTFLYSRTVCRIIKTPKVNRILLRL